MKWSIAIQAQPHKCVYDKFSKYAILMSSSIETNCAYMHVQMLYEDTPKQ